MSRNKVPASVAKDNIVIKKMPDAQPAKQDNGVPPSAPDPPYYFDTNALRSLKLGSELPKLLAMCKKGRIRLCICKVVLVEFCRQRFTAYVEDSQHPSQGHINKRTYFDQIYRQYRLWFKQHSVEILDIDLADTNAVQQFFDDKDSKFNPENKSDQRDALIASAAIGKYKPSEVIIVCQEKKVSEALEARGYQTISDAVRLVASFDTQGETYQQELPSAEDALTQIESCYQDKTFIDRLRSMYTELDEIIGPQSSPEKEALLVNKLNELGDADKELRIDIMACIQALAPVTHEELLTTLSTKAPQDSLKSNIQVLSDSNIIVSTGNHWIPNRTDKVAQQICEQAMANRVDDIIALMEARQA